MSACVALSRESLAVSAEIRRHSARIHCDFAFWEVNAKDRLYYVLGNSLVMSTDSAVTYTSIHSEARSWSIPSEVPSRGELARQLLDQAHILQSMYLNPLEREDHVPVYIPEPEHPEDLVPAEDEAPIEAYIT
ncbi:hypothetical protein Tco_1361091 [Tanacetum coccineum]